MRRLWCKEECTQYAAFAVVANAEFKTFFPYLNLNCCLVQQWLQAGSPLSWQQAYDMHALASYGSSSRTVPWWTSKVHSNLPHKVERLAHFMSTSVQQKVVAK